MNNKIINFQDAIYYLVILFAFTLPLSRALISFSIILIPLLWLLEGKFQEKYNKIKSNKLLISITAFLLFSTLSLIWTENFEIGLNVLRKEMYFITLFVIATTIKREQIESIITAFLFGMLISEIIAYGVFFELWTFKNATVENPSPFMMHIDYSVFMAFTSLLLLNKILSNRYLLKQKLLYLVFFMTVTGNLFLAIGRTGQVAFFLGIFTVAIIHFKISLKSILISLSLLTLISFTAYNISDTFKVRVHAGISDIEKISNINLNSSLGIRVAYYIVTWDSLKNDFILGIGIGDYKDIIDSTIDANNYQFISKGTKKFMKKYHPHSQYLLILLQLGIVGILLLFYLIYQLLKLKIANTEIKELSIIFTVLFFISSIPEPLLAKQFTLGLFILFVGLFSIESTQINAKDSAYSALK